MRLAAMLGVVVVILGPARALACSCASGLFVQLPAPGASGVPTNTRIFVGDAAIEPMATPVPPTLGGPDGPVEVTIQRIDAARGTFVLVLEPVAGLVPFATYEVTTGSWRQQWRFTTGSGADTQSPNPPTLRQVDETYESGETSSCGEWSVVNLDVDAAADLVLLDVSDHAALDGLSGRVSDIVTGPDVWIGFGGCLDNVEASPGDPITIRAAGVDLAGNMSAWSDPLETDLPIGCGGCASGAGAAPGLLALAAWLGFYLKRGSSAAPRRARPPSSPR